MERICKSLQSSCCVVAVEHMQWEKPFLTCLEQPNLFVFLSSKSLLFSMLREANIKN